MNRTLRSICTDTRVCLHPDRSVALSGLVVSVECDYCPQVAVAYDGTYPDLVPWYYSIKEGTA